MADSQGSEAPSNPSTNSRGHRPRGGRSSGNHRGRGGRGNRPQRGQQTPGRNEAPPAGQLPSISGPSPPQLIAPPPSPANPINPTSSGGRGRRAPRSPRRGGSENIPRTTMARPRTFGGHLTSRNEAGESSSGISRRFHMDPPAYIGQEVVVYTKDPATGQHVKVKNNNNASRRGEKSTADDLSTRIHEDIHNGQYECVICTSEILPISKVWSCPICWTVSHLPCVKEWFRNRGRNPNQQQDTWRCPGCNSSLTDGPTTYHCWCGKEINPKSIPGLNPHSCGQTCLKPGGKCPHRCSLMCHAGPCPPCLAMGPSQSCFCGRLTSTRRCSETDYKDGWSCHEVCGDPLPCGEHECQRECHPGLCGSCEVPTLAFCYCGRESQERPCDQLGEKQASYNFGQVEYGVPKRNDLPQDWYFGSFKCDSICDRVFDCGKHRCEKSCHPQDEFEAHCPLSPDLITRCPCGKSPLTDITNQPRQTCEDSIPNCGRPCNKPLSCGHICQDICHNGNCAPCMQKIEISCRCGRTKTSSVCHQGSLQAPECMRICHAQLNCGRHEHSERCCPGEKRALERAALKKKSRITTYTNDEVEAEHICTRTCGRPLKCGIHQCQQLCHRGPCPSCPEAIFDEISCNCGRTVLFPPLACGTKPPPCRFDCTRPRPCGHPQITHNCHLDGEPCPKCPFLVQKQCVCGKKTLKNQPCWFEEPRCGLPCGRKLKCGAHTCVKTCHGPGECEDTEIVGSRCGQPCGKTRACGHCDTEPCHAPYPCKDDRPCQALTFVTCECQRKKQEVKCLGTKKNPSPKRGTVSCDEQCLLLQRNVRLAEALNIDPQTHTDNHVPYSNTTLGFYRENPQFAQTYEREYRVLATDPAQKLLRFKPMKSSQRAFLHSLAEDYGFDSESTDPEPHRHVCLFKTPRFVSAPMKTLAQCVNIRAPSQQILSTQPKASSSESIPAKQPFNALLLSAPRFGLTIEELTSPLRMQYAAYPSIKFHMSFIPEAVIINGEDRLRPQDLESSMSALKPIVSRTVKSLGLAQGVSLCHVDDKLNILRNEKDEEDGMAKGDGGWSAVMRRSARSTPAAAAPPLQPVSSRNNFIALRKAPKKAEEKTTEEDVEDDWEAAAEKLEEE
ncbi:hypothetical protein F4804DRAFT_326492 [Jackrogersella minutella]|nr:hypothetical protein F4804DRAFT_326492 [Jackrogersella minutella]